MDYKNKMKDIELRLKYLQKEKEDICEPLNVEIRSLVKELDNLSYTEVFRWIEQGLVIGCKSHWTSPYYKFDYNDWTKLGWDSLEEFVKSQSSDFYTKDLDLILED